MPGDAGPGPGKIGPQNEELTLLTGSNAIKLILLGDSASGKSKLVERVLLDEYKPHQLSTYALTLYRHIYKGEDGVSTPVDIWDTAGQDRFNSLHPSYYYRAHVCLMVFDVTRKVTYKNLDRWYDELRQFCPSIPVLVLANKIDVDMSVTTRNFGFATKHDLPLFYVSASNGTNVVKAFKAAMAAGLQYKRAPKDDFYLEVVDLLGELE